MIYFYNVTDKSDIVNKYKGTLSPDLQKKYEEITHERRRIWSRSSSFLCGDLLY
jgi:hypothetical protein